MINKRGQVTLFIIIAVIIVALAVLFYMLSPRIGIALSPEAKNPQGFIKTCIEDEIQDKVDMISVQGGSLNPEHYFTYNDEKIEYLCYTNEYYVPCIIQQPLLESHIESEIKNGIQNQVDSCFNSLKKSYEEKGYAVNLKPGETNVELLPDRILTRFDYRVTLTKEETEEYKQFVMVLNNNLYELVSIANSIIEWEEAYGDADPTIYMTYYPDLKVDKNLRDDGTTIYVLTDRSGADKFQFASRSVAWPPGY